MRKPNPWHPKSRGDFGDIGDIFRKPSNHAGLLAFELGDILGMSPRDGDACPHARKGASGDDLSPTVWMAVFSRFGGSNTLRRVSVRLAPKPPQKGPFWGLIGRRIESTGAAHTQGYLARGNPGFRREAHSAQDHKSRIILSWSQRRLFPRF